VQPRHLGEGVQLLGHHLATAYLPAQAGFGEHERHLGRILPGEDRLALLAGLNAALQIVGRPEWLGVGVQRPDVAVGLQQPGDQLDLDGPQRGGVALQVHEHPEPLRVHRAVAVPPATFALPAGEVEEDLDVLGAVAVELGEHFGVARGDVALRQLDAADLADRAAEVRGRLDGRHAGFDAHPLQLVGEHQTADGRSGSHCTVPPG
jgi:hypothetical protein